MSNRNDINGKSYSLWYSFRCQKIRQKADPEICPGGDPDDYQNLRPAWRSSFLASFNRVRGRASVPWIRHWIRNIPLVMMYHGVWGFQRKNVLFCFVNHVYITILKRHCRGEGNSGLFQNNKTCIALAYIHNRSRKPLQTVICER